jgi:hypothetical protein
MAEGRSMNLAGRIAKLERLVGSPEQAKQVYVSTAGARHEIRRLAVNCIALVVPWREEYRERKGPGVRDPLKDLTPRQQAMIGRRDKINLYVIDPAELGGRDKFTGL